MTRTDALKALREGKPITHQYFSKDEYVEIVDGQLKDEKRHILPYYEFFNIRQGGSWEKDWSIFNK